MFEGIKHYTSMILPLVYKESLSYYEQLVGFCEKLNEVIAKFNSYVAPKVTATVEIGSPTDVETVETEDGYELDFTLDISEAVIAPRKYLFVGDSWLGGEITGQDDTVNYGSRFAQYMHLTVGEDVFLHHRNGCKFNATSGTNNFEHELALAIDDYGDEAITDVIIAGGVNDYNNNSSQSEISDGALACYNLVKTAWPNAKLWICCAMGTQRKSQAAGMEDTYRMYAEAASACGCPFIPAYNLFQFPIFMANLHHPNQTGQNELAKLLVSELNGGHYVYQDHYTLSITYSGESDSMTGGLVYRCSDSFEAHIDMARAVAREITTVASLTCDGAHSITVGTWVCSGLFGYYESDLTRVMCMCGFRDESGWYVLPTKVGFNSTGDVTFTPLGYDGTSYLELTNISRVSIMSNSLAVPAQNI